jgi:hypothetical protein
MKFVPCIARTFLAIISLIIICYVLFFQVYLILKEESMINEKEEECLVEIVLYILSLGFKCLVAFLAGGFVTDKKYILLGII